MKNNGAQNIALNRSSQGGCEQVHPVTVFRCQWRWEQPSPPTLLAEANNKYSCQRGGSSRAQKEGGEHDGRHESKQTNV